jgi:hypothetical protein
MNNLTVPALKWLARMTDSALYFNLSYFQGLCALKKTDIWVKVQKHSNSNILDTHVSEQRFFCTHSKKKNIDMIYT